MIKNGTTGNDCSLHYWNGMFWNKGNDLYFLGLWLWLLYHSFETKHTRERKGK